MIDKFFISKLGPVQASQITGMIDTIIKAQTY